jgi:hypothetical protein
MKRFLVVLLFAFAVALVPNTPVFASSADTDVEMSIQKKADRINDDASTPAGEAAVIEKIEKEFGVDKSTITELRAKNLGYGEISMALSLADRLPGGLTDENINKVVAMRQGPPVAGWGNVAKELNLKLKPAKERLEKVSGDSKKDKSKAKSREDRMKHEKSKKGEKTDSAVKTEKSEPVEKMEKMERPEKPAMGGKK